MKAKLRLLLVMLALSFSVKAHGNPSASDLVGRWESTVEFGKFKFRMVVRIAKSADDKVQAKVDIPEQGAKDIPVNALLYNHPAVRWEIDQFGMAFNGKLNEAASEISGAFDEGPGGKPISLVFKRSQGEIAEPKRSYTFAPGEARDIRGYWQAAIEPQPGMKLRIGLKIGHAPDETFAVAMDLFDQGSKDLPATSASYTNSVARFEWQLFQTSFEGKLNEDGTRLSGDWKQRGRPLAVSFERLDQPATVLPANVSFAAKKDSPDDIRGYWKGALNVQGNKLRLVLKLGQTPEGSFAGTLASPDQGSFEVPISTVGYTNPVVRLEWNGIRGVYKGTLNKEGTVMDGTWEQAGTELELKLERTTAPEARGDSSAPR